MTININGTNGMFPILKKIFATLQAVHDAQGTAVPDAMDDALAEMSSLLESTTSSAIAANATRAVQQWVAEASLASSLRSLCEAVLLRLVEVDQPTQANNIDQAVVELIRQMVAEGESVKENTVSVSVTRNNSDAPLLMASVIGADGIPLQQVLPEMLVGTAWNGALSLIGAATKSALSAQWPGGSGISITLTPVTAAAGVLINASFDNHTTRPDSPDNWTVPVGDIGTTLRITTTEVQTVAISGTPTSGTYTLTFTNVTGDIQTTAPLAFDADGSVVQAALQALDGLESVTVSTSGTSPNYTHTIAFNAVDPAGNQSLLTADELFDTGAIAVSEVTAGSANSLAYRALTFVGNGSELTTIQQLLRNQSPRAVLAFGIQLKRSSSATGIVQIRLVDGQGNTVADDAGIDNEKNININSAVGSSAFSQHSAFFRLPAVLPKFLSLQIRLTTAINNGQSLYLDEAILTSATSCYTGGPLVALLDNGRSLTMADRYTVTVANDHAGTNQTWFGRMFGAQLPSATSGSETIAD